ncbi:flavin reductase family protein [Microbacterium sp. Marseille-Q6965]|uniref:flavin reductase family protein n=1 Tax=Microbacterium sp. Marseille-Q6965 TaxID=2965072 RepID=UPI0021B736C7|nr:flavin reductase family protein [Microbacterium sp. Marseille-Q6965]
MTEVTAMTDRFKAVFRQHPAAVTLITGLAPGGPVGLTASSLSSVAAAPPAVSFSVTRATGSAGGLLSAGEVSVHLLGAQHAATALAFSRSGEERFTAAQGWEWDADGHPVLPDARATLRCRIVDTLRVADSSLVVAEVLDVVIGPDAEPLLYHDRRFHAFDPSARVLDPTLPTAAVSDPQPPRA